MSTTRDKRWLEDLDYLSEELPKRHKNLFFNTNEKDFYSKILELKDNVQHYDDYELYVNTAKIVTSIGDAHTSIPLPVRFLCPLRFYWFSDGIYIIETTPEYREILNCKIKYINKVNIDEVISVLKSIVSYENEYFLRAQLPKYLPAIEVLYGLEIVDEIDGMNIIVEDVYGNIKCVGIKALPFREANESLGNSLDIILDQNKLALYRWNNDKYFWFEYLGDLSLVYFKYNACREMKYENVSDFSRRLISFINENRVEKLVIDLRNNSGGDSTLLDEFIDNISKCDRLNKRGNLYVIVGRDTFSSALLNVFSLKEKTKAIFLGEPTGGKPNCYGEVKRFNLKNSGLTVCYSSKYYEVIDDDSILSFYPDIEIEVTALNYINNEDPILNYIISN